MEKKKILVVDDDIALLHLIKFRLKEKFQVLLANKAETALEIINAQENLHCLIVDYMMGDMSGIKLTEIVRSNPRIKNIPIILLTSCEDEHLVRRAYRAGINLFLLKSAINGLNEMQIDYLIEHIHEAKTYQDLINISERIR